jgi:FAD/FMN-containing dehydrogenase
MALKAAYLVLLAATYSLALSIERRAAIDTCLSAAKVPTDVKTASNWTQDASPFNARLPYTPAAIAVPTTIPQIQAAVNCARTSGVKATAKCGGHSYASLGLGGEDGHLVIELDLMYNVTLDKTTNISTVQPGARLGHVANSLWSQGQRAISAGTCPGYATMASILKLR